MNNLPVYPLPPDAFEATDNPEQVLDQYSDFFDVLDDSQQKGLLDVHPISRLEASNPSANASRYETIRSRLKWLGYRPGRATINRVSDRFEKAVWAFQQDAQITEDGWVGSQTWYALDVLVGYESVLSPTDWFHEGEPKLALLRAIQLRLWSLGLAKNQPKSDDPRPGPNLLDSFRQIIKIFNIPTQAEVGEGITPELVSLLFDQDLLVNVLAGSGGPAIKGFRSLHHFKVSVPSGMRSRDADRLAARFITCMAMVELYLHGFNIDIGKRIHYNIGKPDGNGRQKNGRLYLAFHAFWRQVGDPKRKPNTLAQSIVPEFFETLKQMRQKADAETLAGEDHSQELARQFKENTQFRASFWTQLKNVGKRLWDGMKRIWRWIKAKSAKILEYGVNMVRAFFRFGLKSFKILKAAGGAVATGIQFLFNKVVAGSSPGTVQIIHDGDFDFTAFINPSADSQALQKMSSKLSHQANMFALGTKILGLVLRLLRGAITMVGWPGIFYVLVKSYSSIKTVYQELRHST